MLLIDCLIIKKDPYKPEFVRAELSQKILEYFEKGVKIENMVGTLTNYNYPEDFKTLFNLTSDYNLIAIRHGENLT